MLRKNGKKLRTFYSAQDLGKAIEYLVKLLNKEVSVSEAAMNHPLIQKERQRMLTE